MIVVHAQVRCRPEFRQQMVEFLLRLQNLTRERDDGCLSYTYSVDLNDDCLFTCVEEWRDMAALRAHLAADHMNDPLSRFADWSDGEEAVRVFNATAASLP